MMFFKWLNNRFPDVLESARVVYFVSSIFSLLVLFVWFVTGKVSLPFWEPVSLIALINLPIFFMIFVFPRLRPIPRWLVDQWVDYRYFAATGGKRKRDDEVDLSDDADDETGDDIQSESLIKQGIGRNNHE